MLAENEWGYWVSLIAQLNLLVFRGRGKSAGYRSGIFIGLCKGCPSDSLSAQPPAPPLQGAGGGQPNLLA